MPADLLLQQGLPGHELEAETVVDLGETPADQIDRAGEPAGHILTRLARDVGKTTLGSHRPADTINFGDL